MYQKGKNKYKSLVGNAFEALFGAILLDKGYEFTKLCFTKYILNSHLDIQQILLNNRDYKSELLIHFQKNGGKIIFKTTNINWLNWLSHQLSIIFFVFAPPIIWTLLHP